MVFLSKKLTTLKGVKWSVLLYLNTCNIKIRLIGLEPIFLEPKPKAFSYLSYKRKLKNYVTTTNKTNYFR